MRNGLLYSVVAALAVVAGLGFSWYQHGDQLFQSPRTSVRVYHYPISFIKQIRHDPLASVKIFDHYCQSCHGRHAIIDVHAPHVGDKQAWARYLKLGLPTVTRYTLNGHKKMPEQGGCFECTPEQVKKTMMYMLRQSGFRTGQS